jgi:hypothetical protein
MRTPLLFLAFILSTAFAKHAHHTKRDPSNNCVTFSVTQGTGCAWMCNYCANQLGTNNYYFTDGVCIYQQGTGCVGNPLSGVSYTCCSA